MKKQVIILIFFMSGAAKIFSQTVKIKECVNRQYQEITISGLEKLWGLSLGGCNGDSSDHATLYYSTFKVGDTKGQKFMFAYDLPYKADKTVITIGYTFPQNSKEDHAVITFEFNFAQCDLIWPTETEQITFYNK